jgi:SPP1 family predicted phage head-tail adaptor
MAAGTAGEKRTQVRIEKTVTTPDGQGGQTVTWALRAVVFAHERPLNGTEALRAAQVTAVLSTVLEIWHRTDISVKDRVLIGSRVLQIESYADPDDTRTELYLTCSEIQN